MSTREQETGRTCRICMETWTEDQDGICLECRSLPREIIKIREKLDELMLEYGRLCYAINEENRLDWGGCNRFRDGCTCEQCLAAMKKCQEVIQYKRELERRIKNVAVEEVGARGS